MIAIVNTDKNWGIGQDGGLQVHISNDLKRFKELTTGKVIIYGSKTLATYPGFKVLPNRRNLILSRNRNLEVEGAEIFHSLDELLTGINKIKKEEDYQDEDFIVVGGESVYRQLLPYCTLCHVTRMDVVLEADAYFPNLDQDEAWEESEKSDVQYDSKNDIKYYYVTYKRK